MAPRSVVIAGGSGFLGQALKRRLEESGREIVTLSRSGGPGALPWDGKTVGDWWKTLDGAEAVVNLAGRSIDCRFTPENRRLTLESRVDSVKAIGEAIWRCETPPKLWLQSSAMAIYGNAGDRECREQDAPSRDDLLTSIADSEFVRAFGSGAGRESSSSDRSSRAIPCPEPPSPTPSSSEAGGRGFSPSESGEGGSSFAARMGESVFAGMRALPVATFMQLVCVAWEGGLAGVETPSTRKTALRSAVVLGAGQGAFAKIWKLVMWGLGGQASNGKQYFSWIHVDDWVDAVAFLLEHPDAEGAFNLSSPNPVRNSDLMAALRKAAHRPWSPPVPAPLLRLGSRLLGTEGDLVLQGQRVIPQRLIDAGFRFSYVDIDSAVRELASR